MGTPEIKWLFTTDFYANMNYFNEQDIINKVKSWEAILVRKEEYKKLLDERRRLEQIINVISRKDSNYWCATLTQTISIKSK